MPPRTTLSLNLTATLGMTGVPLASAIAQAQVHDPSSRLMKRYSALALQLRPNATSTPAPTVQPASTELVTGSLEKFARTLPKAAPPGAVNKEAIECVAGAAARVLSQLLVVRHPPGTEDWKP